MWERLALCEQVWRNVDQDCLAEYEYGNSFWIVQIEQKHWILMMLCWSWQAAVLLVYILIHRSLRWSILSLFQEGLAKWSPGFHDLSHTDCFLTGLAGPLRLRGRLHKLPQPSHPGCELCGKNWESYSQHRRWPPARTLSSALRAILGNRVPEFPAPAIDGRHWDPQRAPWAAALIGSWGYFSFFLRLVSIANTEKKMLSKGKPSP